MRQTLRRVWATSSTGDARVVYGKFHRKTDLHRLHFPFRDIMGTNQIHAKSTLSHRGSQIHTAAQVRVDILTNRQLLRRLPSWTCETETGGGHRGLLFAPV